MILAKQNTKINTVDITSCLNAKGSAPRTLSRKKKTRKCILEHLNVNKLTKFQLTRTSKAFSLTKVTRSTHHAPRHTQNAPSIGKKHSPTLLTTGETKMQLVGSKLEWQTQPDTIGDHLSHHGAQAEADSEKIDRQIDAADVPQRLFRRAELACSVLCFPVPRLLLSQH